MFTKPAYTLWSLRYSIARGSYWQNERECNDDTACQWLAVFKKDEPKVIFILQKGKRKPPLTKLFRLVTSISIVL